MRDVRAVVETIVAQAVAEYREAAPYMAQPVYAWFSRGIDMPSGYRKPGCVYIAPDRPWINAELVTGERIPAGLTYDGIKAWINARMGAVPIL